MARTRELDAVQREVRSKLRVAQEHEKAGNFASASVLLTLNMLKLTKTIDGFHGNKDSL
eukprot:SAG11_NODE_37839_length_255_cov_0.647436_1_plen_58_part_01